MKKFLEMLHDRFYFVTYIGNISYSYIKQFLNIQFFDCLCVFFYLSGRFSPLKRKLLSDWIRQLEIKTIFFIGNDNALNGALFPFGHDFYLRIPFKKG